MERAATHGAAQELDWDALDTCSRHRLRLAALVAERERLVRVKRKYDPNNGFRFAQSIGAAG